MFRETSKLIIYSNCARGTILGDLADIFRRFDAGVDTPEKLRADVYLQVRRLLEVATKYGFDNNLWHNYLAYLLITDENPLRLTYEKAGAKQGSANVFAEGDMRVFKALFDFDFEPIQKALDIDCFTVLSNYHAIEKREQIYNRNVSEKVRDLAKKLDAAADGRAAFEIVADFYRAYGVGMLGLNKAFRLDESCEKGFALRPITNMAQTRFEDLVGYERQKQMLIDNTEAFVAGRSANNVLLYGDSGTGKSTSIKAIVNRYYNDGLRMIEIYKHQFHYLPRIISEIKNRNYRFIIYMDDLSFEDQEVEYKYLKAVIEGGVETRPYNVLIYATSNRRHLIKETWRDRTDTELDGDIHRSETIEEKLSLVNRFGLSIGYMKPSKQEFEEIVRSLAQRAGIGGMSDEELMLEAHRWEMRNGGISGRTARQFIDSLATK